MITSAASLERLKQLQQTHLETTRPMDSYYTGMYNGMEFMLSVIEDRAPKYMEVNKKMQTHEAVHLLNKQLANDPGYRVAWVANIAMAFKDEWQRAVDGGGLPSSPEQIHNIANYAAEYFLNSLMGNFPRSDQFDAGPTLKVLGEIKSERKRQHEKWGQQNHKPADWLMILGEEVGEANKAALEVHFNYPNSSIVDYRTELIQVAAVAVAMVECFDRNHPNHDGVENGK